MNCRKVNSLLSAYIDAELPKEDMEAVGEHLIRCSGCRLEHETLMQTKRAVASLANRVSREEIVRLLAAAETDTQAVANWGMPVHWKVSSVAVTIAFSLAGLWLATSSLDSPRDWHRSGAYAEFEPLPSALSPVSMTPLLAPNDPPVTMAVVSNPTTMYALNGNGTLNRVTVRQVHFYSSVPRPPSLREAIMNRLFGTSQRSTIPGYDAAGLNPFPMVRALNGRDDSGSHSSVLSAGFWGDRHVTPAMFR